MAKFVKLQANDVIFFKLAKSGRKALDRYLRKHDGYINSLRSVDGYHTLFLHEFMRVFGMYYEEVHAIGSHLFEEIKVEK